MQALKGSWVGQTFALAKSNESGGKKSRIRRSKEERKAMVESFIKKYQKLNNGTFPSLNLTHKEVGGSFYTIREIVREIIQENRVLGPAKWTPEQQNTDQLEEKYPLGSISIEPQVPLPLSSNESHFILEHDHGRIEPVSIPNRLPIELGYQILDSGQTINGSHVDVENEESHEEACAEKKLSEPLEAEINNKEVGATTATVTCLTEDVVATTAIVTEVTADVTVETFPLKQFTKPPICLDEPSGELSKFGLTLEANETKKEDLGPDDGDIKSIGSVEISARNSGLLDGKGIENAASSLSERNSALMQKEAGVNSVDPSLGSSVHSTTKEGIPHHTLVGNDVEIEAPHDDISIPPIVEGSQPIARTETTNGPNNIHTKSDNGTGTGNSMVSTIQEAASAETKIEGQHRASTQKRSNMTLNRIKPESWEETSKNATEQETNPLWAAFKSFIAAFIKFWTE